MLLLLLLLLPRRLLPACWGNDIRQCNHILQGSKKSSM
jgi:hypothetical protein